MVVTTDLYKDWLQHARAGLMKRLGTFITLIND